MNTIFLRQIVVALTTLYLNACTIVPEYSHTNKPLKKETTAGSIESEVFNPVMRASEVVPWRINSKCRNEATPNTLNACKTDDPNFIAIAISGGGTRSAIFAAEVMFELQRYDLLVDNEEDVISLLDNVDVITCVSGGCITAAYYALSCTETDKSKCLPTHTKTRRPNWKKNRVNNLLTRNYELRWFGNWFWPENILRYWFTYYDRTDIMAETLSDNLYDRSRFGGKPFRFKDLNLRRPNLLISSVNGAASNEKYLPFLFSTQQFFDIESNLARYQIADAVMASATFPGVFQYMTLKDFSVKPVPTAFYDPEDFTPSVDGSTAYSKKTFLHLLDGGTWDNLGLKTLKRVMERSEIQEEGPPPVLVISIDAFLPFSGKDSQKPEARDWPIDYIVDTNFMDAYDVLLASGRESAVETINTLVPEQDERKHFMHITFTKLDKDMPVYKVVSEVSTDFSVKPYQAKCLKRAAQILVRKEIQILSEKKPQLANMIVMPTNDHLADCSPQEGKTP